MNSRLLLVFFAALPSIGCATLATSKPMLERHSLFGSVELSLPAEFRRNPTAGSDSRLAEFTSSSVKIIVESGTHAPQIPFDATNTVSYEAMSGQLLEQAEITQGMKYYPYGIRIVERRAPLQSGDAEVETARLSIGIFCRQRKECIPPARAIKQSLLFELDDSTE